MSVYVGKVMVNMNQEPVLCTVMVIVTTSVVISCATASIISIDQVCYEIVGLE